MPQNAAAVDGGAAIVTIRDKHHPQPAPGKFFPTRPVRGMIIFACRACCAWCAHMRPKFVAKGGITTSPNLWPCRSNGGTYTGGAGGKEAVRAPQNAHGFIGSPDGESWQRLFNGLFSILL